MCLEGYRLNGNSFCRLGQHSLLDQRKGCIKMHSGFFLVKREEVQIDGFNLFHTVTSLITFLRSSIMLFMVK